MLRNGRIPTAQQLYFQSVSRDVAEQDEVERRFFRAIKQKNGPYKSTRSNRLDDLNDFVAGMLPPDRPLRVMDVAVSSGISTLEWSKSLDRQGVEHSMTAGDINLTCYLASIGKRLNVLVDQSGHPLQYDIFGHAVTNPPPRRWLLASLPFVLLFRSWLRLSFTPRRHEGRWTRCRPVTLVSPRLLEDHQVHLIEDNIVSNDSLRGQFHVVRAANILNRSYFSDATLTRIASNLRDRLVEGGLLVVCTTSGDDDGETSSITNDGTVFVRRESGKLDVAGRIGAGSVVEDVVLRVPDSVETRDSALST